MVRVYEYLFDTGKGIYNVVYVDKQHEDNNPEFNNFIFNCNYFVEFVSLNKESEDLIYVNGLGFCKQLKNVLEN